MTQPEYTQLSDPTPAAPGVYPPQRPYAPYGEPADSIHLREIGNILLRRWWLIALALVTATAAALWTVSQREPLYFSEMSLQVNSPEQRQADLNIVRGDVNELEGFQFNRIQSELEVLSSRDVAASVVRVLGLRVRPVDGELVRSDLFSSAEVPDNFPEGTYTLVYSEDGRVVSLLGEADRLLARAPVGEPLRVGDFQLTATLPPSQNRRYTLAVQSLYTAAAEVQAGLSAQPQEQTDVIDVQYVGRDPVFVPEILRATALALRQHGLQRNRVIATRRVETLEDLLVSASADLTRAQRAVQDFKTQRAVTDLGSEEQNVFQQTREYEQATQDLGLEIQTYESLIRRLRAGSANKADLDQIAALPTLNANASIQFHLRQILNLRDERQAKTSGSGAMSEAHADIVGIDQRIGQAQDNLVAALTSQLASLQDRRNNLGARAEQSRREMSAFPGIRTELADLERRKETAEQHYRWAEGELRRARLAESVVSPYVDVVDAPSPVAMVRTRNVLNVIAGALLGLVVGIALAFLLEYFDRTVRTSGDVERNLHLPSLGLVPRLPPRPSRATVGTERLQPAHALAAADPLSPAAEAYRALLVNLLFSRPAEDALRVVTVTSTGPAEGKSTTALNLAVTLAQQGKHTLLVDADLRNPTLHRALQLDREPGLSNILTGGSTFRKALRRDVVPGLDVLSAGPLTPNPAELFDSKAFTNLLDSLRSKYDWVLIDSPPVLAVSDATLLGLKSDGALFVVRAGETDQGAAEHAVARLQRIGVRMVGAVLNEVDRFSSPDAAYTKYYYRYREVPGEHAPVRPNWTRQLLGGARFW